VIQSSQLGTVWVNFVHAAHLGQSAPTARRRRDLALALPGDMAQLTPISALTRLTPDLAAHYAGKTPKTLTRDINALEEAGLIVRQGSAIRPFLERLFAFLPLRKPEPPSPPEPGSERELLATLAAASVPITPGDVRIEDDQQREASSPK